MKRVFEGTLVPPNESGLVTWILVKDPASKIPLGQDPTDVTDEDMFGGLEGEYVRVTVGVLGEQGPTVTIVVNGSKQETLATEMTYDEIVQLAFPDATPSAAYSVLFRCRRGDWEQAGSVLPRAVVGLLDGMVFNVANTGGA